MNRTEFTTQNEHARGVRDASNEMKAFLASNPGQELLDTMHQVFEDVQMIAQKCRGRHRIHGFFKAAAGAAAITGGIIVIVAGAIMSGGTALPAEIAAATAFFVGGTVTLASAAAVQITNTLVSLGIDKGQAQQASARMVELTELIKQWDVLFNNLLHAGGTLSSLSESIDAVSFGIAGVTSGETAKDAMTVGSSAKGVYGIVQSGVAAKDAMLIQNVMRSFLDLGLDGYVAGGTGYGVVAPQAMFGLVKAGSAGARGLFFGLSGVGIAFSLVDVIAGLSSMAGQSEAADCLDAHADKLCMLLQIMLIAGRSTPVPDRVLNAGLPQLLVIRPSAYVVGKPSYRFGDLSRKAYRKLSGAPTPEHRVYFRISVRNRNRETEVVTLAEHRDVVRADNTQVIIMRVLEGDTSLALQMCARRALAHRMTAGDSSMSSQFGLDLPCASDTCTSYDCDDTVVECQVLDPPQS